MTANAAPGDSTVTVNVKSLRSASSTVDGLAGVTVRLFEDDAANNTAGAATPFTCLTDASGVCTITVPNTQNNGANNKRFWVRVDSAPNGYFVNDYLVTGNNTTQGNDRFAATPQAYRTPVLNNSTVTMPSTSSMPSTSKLPGINNQVSTSDRWVSGAAFSVSKNNNRYQPTCTPPVEIAVVLDLSLSMEGAGLAGAKAAAKQFIASLVGSGATVALYTFSTTAPADSGNSGRNWAALEVTQANLATFNSRIDAYTTWGYTNWDRGLWQVKDAAGNYDLAVVLTDGNPTVFGSEPTSTWTNLQKTQEAVFSANALKSEGTQILAFGVGTGLSGPADNLIAISGATPWNGQAGTVASSDYFQTDKWADVGMGLTSLAKSVTCAVPIEVTKTEVLANGTTQAGNGWEFTATNSGGVGALPNGTQVTANGGKANWTLTFAKPGDSTSISLTETAKQGWTFTSVECTNKGTVIPNIPQSLPISIPGVKVGDDIKCAVTNTQPQAASLKVVKLWVVNDGAPVANGQQPDGLSAQLTVNGDDKAWGAVHAGYTKGSTVTLNEKTTDTSELCTITDKKLTSPSTAALPYQATLANATNEYAITNYVTCDSAPQLQLKKVVTDGVVPANKWTLTATASGATTITGKGLAPYAPAKAGIAYSLTETPDAGYEGFTKSAWVCTITDGPGTGQTLPTTGDKVTLSVNTKVECVITNTAKNVVPGFDKAAGTATANADGTWNVSYTLTASNPSAVLGVTFDIDDTPNLPAGVTGVSATVQPQGGAASTFPWTSGTFTVADDVTIAAGGAPKVYTVTLTVSVAPGTAPTSLECKPAGGGMDNDAVLTPVGGTPIADHACVSITPPTVSHTKTLKSYSQNADGTWTVVYDVNVTAAGSGVALYNLSDVPKFGAGITATGTATGPAQAASWDGAGTTTLATNQPIQAGAAQKYTITLIATVAAGVIGTPAADCTLEQGEAGTGFLNTATLTVNGKSTTDEDCASPVKPTLDKAWISTTQNPDDTWRVTFEVKVANPSDTAGLYYSLTDTPAFLDGVTVTGRTVALNGGAASPWNGTDPLATNRSLPKSTTDTYVLVFTVDVPLGLPSDRLDCKPTTPKHGFFNSSTMTSGNDSTTDTDCGPVKEGVLPLVEKTVKPGFPRQVAGGDWVIQYTVTVSTPQGNTLAAKYNLSDALKFGDGITVLSSSIAGPVATNPNWNGRTDTSVVSNIVLPAGQSHVYTVSVSARLAEGVVNTPAADCTLERPETGTGFLNTVVLTSGSLERTAEACKSPAAPEFTKDLVGTPVKGADGKYTITYTLKATNPSTLELNYDLDDTLGFASGVTISSATVTGAQGIPTNAAWNGAGTTRVTTGKAIAAGVTDTYTVTVVATPTVNIADANLACKEATPGKGYFNGAVLTSGADTYADDACAPITKVELPKLASTGSSVNAAWWVGGALLLVLGAALLALRAKRRQPKH